MAALIITNSVSINASAAKVWDALVNPSKTKLYMFGCETVSDWKPGSPLLWKGLHEGREMIFVKGEVVEIKPGKHLKYTTIDPNSTIDDISENYLWVTYDLTETNGMTTLTVRQGDYATVADGANRYKDSYNNGEGWNPILQTIKKLVESN